MKALILNSGLGSRMGELTAQSPKCMTKISSEDTILSRQLKQLSAAGIEEVVITTGYLPGAVEDHCAALGLPIKLTFVHNPLFDKTNYIYSIYLARACLQEDILLMHGDLVFDSIALDRILAAEESSMAVSSALPLPREDFKAVIDEGRIVRIGTEFFDNALAAQPLYKLKREDWLVWLERIAAYCESEDPAKLNCYAENAFNEVSDRCCIKPLDLGDILCAEIDDPRSLAEVTEGLAKLEERSVYMCFSTDMIHSGHIAMIKRAAMLGRLTVGVMSDEGVAAYKRFPLLPFSERRATFENIKGVYRVVEQKALSYRDDLEKYKPDILVHGDDWRQGFQQPIREEAIRLLGEYGGQLVEYPYSYDEKYIELERRSRAELSSPNIRRGRLRRLLEMKGMVTAMEAHSGLTGLIVENTVVYENGAARQFDAMWISSLCDSTAKGKPDIELVDMTSRLRTVDDIMEVTTKPIIFDCDTGGLAEHFVYTVRTLERMGVSMIVIEDKTGLKKNSLFGTEVSQTQAKVSDFCDKIRAGKRAQKTDQLMICARIESLILEKGMEDALDRAFAYIAAGADAIMIHSRRTDPEEVFEFVERFRERDGTTPLVAVPTAFNSVYEEELKERGVNVAIYANQLTRSAFPAMKNAAETILRHHRAKECDDICMPIGEIIRLIPEEL